MKKCSKCKKEKEDIEFYEDKSKKLGLSSYCRECRKEHQKKYINTDKGKENQKKYNNSEKAKKYYKKYRNSDKGKEYQRVYQKSDKGKECQREYRKSNKYKEYYNSDKRKRYQREYQKLNKYKEYQREYRNNKKLIDPKFRLDCNMATAIYTALRGKKAGKKWKDLVGYSIEDLMEHLESKFHPWMNWDNYGKWHVDHLVPKSRFHYESPNDPEFKKCWSLENLQPLEAIENFKKGNRFEGYNK